ncbi:DUF3421 domain-containing protein [Favolaschia claudopus]|uniref:DUF3421 domain-containing protein n=1 Tax=Favolaschia claudopus TaxID=2862362 RepID=A0AAW0C1U5_9AGAR
MSYEKGPHTDFAAQEHFAPPPTYSAAQMPSSGFRLALNSSVQISKQDLERAGNAPFADLDGSPVYVGSAIFTHDDGVSQKSVHPCKIGPHLYPSPCMVPYGGSEMAHQGRYDLLLFDPLTMEWVTTSEGRIPEGRTPIEGGYEETIREKLYHACARVNGILVPGKTGTHLGAANVSFGGGEHAIRDNYQILCWKIQKH